MDYSSILYNEEIKFDNITLGHSENKEERIKTRWDRIQKQTEETNDENITTNEIDDNKVIRLLKSEQQILDSLARLDRRNISSRDELTQIKINSQRKENERRIKEEGKRCQRSEKLELEQNASKGMMSDLEERLLSKINMTDGESTPVTTNPRELSKIVENEIINNWKSIIENKKDLIIWFQSQIKEKDREYIHTLERHTTEVDEFRKLSRKQIVEMRKIYDLELDTIQKSFTDDRSNLLKEQRLELKELMNQRGFVELDSIKSEHERRDNFQNVINKMQIQGEEEYMNLKAKLEKDVQQLEHQITEMKTTYQLNADKLEYNCKLLMERDLENKQSMKRQKKKILKCKDDLVHTRQKSREETLINNRKNRLLLKDCERIENQCGSLQTKYHHFENLDRQKLEELRKMHYLDICQLASYTKRAAKSILKDILFSQ